jgi:hypothetical protein
VYNSFPLHHDLCLTRGCYMREIVSTITSKGQVTIPAEIRKQLGVTTGDKLPSWSRRMVLSG